MADDQHDENDDCAKYTPEWQLRRDDGSEVDARDVEVGDVINDAQLDAAGQWFEVRDACSFGDDDVHLYIVALEAS